MTALYQGKERIAKPNRCRARERMVESMRKVKCEDCGKVYDFDAEDFCPRCGAFQFPKGGVQISADGSVVRVDGISESNHKNSFLH